MLKALFFSPWVLAKKTQKANLNTEENLIPVNSEKN